MDMSYPAYDTYNSQVGFPLSRRPSMYSHPSDHTAYDPALTTGVYDVCTLFIQNRRSAHRISQTYPATAYSAPYAPSRQVSQYNGGMSTRTRTCAASRTYAVFQFMTTITTDTTLIMPTQQGTTLLGRLACRAGGGTPPWGCLCALARTMAILSGA